MKPLIQARELSVHFALTRGVLFKRPVQEVRAVDRVSFDIMQGETFSLVGESGCGKSTLARAILQLERSTSGRIFFRESELGRLSNTALRRARQQMQIVFQDPFASLNPRMTVAQIVAEPMIVHRIISSAESRSRVASLLDTVGLDPGMMDRYPHEFSGGQRQRVGIARALAVRPEFIVCDEAVASLDVSIQAQIINLLTRLQRRFGLTYLFIAHDLAIVKHISHRVAAMHTGRIVELAGRDDLFRNPRHPYTQLLLSAVPVPDPEARPTGTDVSRATKPVVREAPPDGCRFRHRCPLATNLCRRTEPELRPVGKGHLVACHHA